MIDTSHKIWAFFVASMFWFTGVAQAEVFTTHSLVGAAGLYGYAAEPLDLPGFLHVSESHGPSDTGLLSDEFSSTGSDLIRGSARATAGIAGSRLLRTFSTGLATGSGTFSPAGEGEGLAVWRDVVLVDSISPPAELRLNFTAHASFNVESFGNTGFRAAVADISLEWEVGVDSSNSLFQALGSGFVQPMGIYGPRFRGASARLVQGNAEDAEIFTQDGAWDQSELVGENFSGSFHIDVPYEESFGGYAWVLALSANTYGGGGQAESNALNTLQLQSVTLTDGTPVVAAFESGLIIGVPEPASGLLVWVGLASVAGLVRSRRRE